MKRTLFDLDGTLVDTVPDIDQALNHALATVGLARVDYLLPDTGLAMVREL